MKRKLAVKPQPWRGPRNRSCFAPIDEECQFGVHRSTSSEQATLHCWHRYAKLVRKDSKTFRACGWHAKLATLDGWEIVGSRLGLK